MILNKQVISVDSGVQQELQNFSNDPEYEVKLSKQQRKGTANKIIEEYATKARIETGIEENEQKEKLTSIKSILTKKRETLNKEEADFDEAEEVFQDNDDDDKIQGGLDYIPDSESDDDIPGAKTDPVTGKKNPILKRNNTNLNEDANELLQVNSIF